MWNASSLVQDLNSYCRVHFLRDNHYTTGTSSFFHIYLTYRSITFFLYWDEFREGHLDSQLTYTLYVTGKTSIMLALLLARHWKRKSEHLSHVQEKYLGWVITNRCKKNQKWTQHHPAIYHFFFQSEQARSGSVSHLVDIWIEHHKFVRKFNKSCNGHIFMSRVSPEIHLCHLNDHILKII